MYLLQKTQFTSEEKVDNPQAVSSRDKQLSHPTVKKELAVKQTISDILITQEVTTAHIFIYIKKEN